MLLAACGSGGGGGGGPVELKSGQDVAREVANLIALNDQSGGMSSKSASASRASVGPRGTLATRLWRQSRRSSSKVAQTETCNGGGTYTSEFFAGQQRSLPFFGVTPVMDLYVEDYNNCKYVNGTYSDTQNGHFESADNYAYTGFTPQNPYYDTVAFGRDNSRVTFVSRDTEFNEVVTLGALGRSETRDNGSVYETRDLVQLDFDSSFDGDRFRVSLDFGSGEDYLAIVDSYTAGTLAVDGPFAYSSTDCPGGSLILSTDQAMTFAEDGFGTYVSGGRLTIDAGTASVDLVFSSNGDVAYEFVGGESGTILRSELVDASGCIFLF